MVDWEQDRTEMEAVGLAVAQTLARLDGHIDGFIGLHMDARPR